MRGRIGWPGSPPAACRGKPTDDIEPAAVATGRRIDIAALRALPLTIAGHDPRRQRLRDATALPPQRDPRLCKTSTSS